MLTGMVKFTVGPEKPLITVEAMVNGKGPFSFIVDTGASHSVLSNQTAEKLGIPLQEAGCYEATRGRSALGAGGAVAARTATVDSLKVGDAEARNIEVAIIDLTNLSNTVKQRLDGIIGKNFMKDYKVIIDYPKQELTFEKP
jgi:clan AA aspartic protease (TIGR02281 family)